MFYDGTKLLSMKDLNGNTPEIFISTSNRSAGKTTYFSRLLVNRFIKRDEKFILLYRYQYEIDNIAEKFFKDINNLFFPDYTMTETIKAKGLYHELLLIRDPDSDPKTCGYALPLNASDKIKKYSHMFSDVKNILFDEFQSENNRYLDNEVSKFISLHTSIARGNGKMSRYLPVYMISNPVTIANPYYLTLGITSRLQANTRFLKGDGYVLEQNFNESASNAQKQSSFNRAFSSDKYTSYASEGIYLNDNEAFIDKIKGKWQYICTLKYNDCFYSLKHNDSILYVDNSYDASYPVIYAVSLSDHDNDTRVFAKTGQLLQILQNYFDLGQVRFKNQMCKNVFFELLKLRI